MTVPQGPAWPWWILGAVLFLFGLYVACMNWAGLLLRRRNRQRANGKGYSQAPVLGPICMYLGLLAMPVHMSPWIYVVLLIDPSTYAVLVAMAIVIRRATARG